MTVRELIKLLDHYPPEAEVVLSMDPEGNGFDTLHDLEIGCYVDGEFCCSDDDPYDRKSHVCLWP